MGKYENKFKVIPNHELAMKRVSHSATYHHEQLNFQWGSVFVNSCFNELSFQLVLLILGVSGLTGALSSTDSNKL